MADVVGTTASIVALVDLCAKIITFIQEVRDGSSERMRLRMEIFSTKGILEALISTVRHAEAAPETWSETIRSLGRKGGPLVVLQGVLLTLHDELSRAVSGNRVERAGRNLLWPFKKKHIEDRLKIIDRQKLLLTLALDNDHIALSKEIQSDTLAIRRDVAAISANIEQHKNDKTRTAILDWLTQVDYTPQHRDFISRRQPGTGQWLLDSLDYQAWRETPKETLFCPGIPGAGKTIITSIVVEDLTTRFTDDPTTGIAYIYCNFRRQDEQATMDLLLNLLKQLSARQLCLPEVVKDLYSRHKDRTRPALDEVSKALQSVVAMYSRVFFTVDALDECQISDGTRMKVLEEMFKLEASGANVFATSRFIPEITESFKGKATLEIRAHDEDVRRYLHNRISQSGKKLLETYCEEIKTEITKSVAGMFLLAQLHFDSVCTKKAIKKMKETLKNLSTGPKSYDNAYGEAMKRISSHDPDSEELAKQVLSWITCAKRPLTTVELQYALAVEVGTSELDEDNLPQTEDMVSVCAGLVTIDEESDVIRLVHYTTQEYFERTREKWFSDAETDIARICITYLSFTAFETVSCETYTEFRERLQWNPFYDYATRNWGHHARAATCYDAITDFLRSPTKREGCSRALLEYEMKLLENSPFGDCQQMTGLHLAAYFGIEAVVSSLLRFCQDVDPEAGSGKTPIILAAKNGHRGVVQLLVDAGANLDRGKFPTPLSWAAKNGHEDVVQLLIEAGADVESGSKKYQETPLYLAASVGHTAIVRLLINAGASITASATGRETPLLSAASNGNVAIAQLLLDADADIEAGGKFGETALWQAAGRGDCPMVQLLLDAGADIEAKDRHFNETPLLCAARRGWHDVVQLLVDAGADVNAIGHHGLTSLGLATMFEHDAVVKVLEAYSAGLS